MQMAGRGGYMKSGSRLGVLVVERGYRRILHNVTVRLSFSTS